MKRILIAALSVFIAGTASAETLPVLKLKESDIVYIQRGWSYDVQECAIEEIRFAQAGNVKTTLITIGDDEPWILFTYGDKTKRYCHPDGIIEYASDGNKYIYKY